MSGVIHQMVSHLTALWDRYVTEGDKPLLPLNHLLSKLETFLRLKRRPFFLCNNSKDVRMHMVAFISSFLLSQALSSTLA